jgi:hypothetical protein
LHSIEDVLLGTTLAMKWTSLHPIVKTEV